MSLIVTTTHPFEYRPTKTVSQEDYGPSLALREVNDDPSNDKPRLDDAYVSISSDLDKFAE